MYILYLHAYLGSCLVSLNAVQYSCLVIEINFISHSCINELPTIANRGTMVRLSVGGVTRSKHICLYVCVYICVCVCVYKWSEWFGVALNASELIKFIDYCTMSKYDWAIYGYSFYTSAFTGVYVSVCVRARRIVYTMRSTMRMNSMSP